MGRDWMNTQEGREMGGYRDLKQGCRTFKVCVRGFLGMSEVASAAARFGQGGLAGRMTRRGGRDLSCCLSTASGMGRLGCGRPGDAGLQNSGSCFDWNCGRSRSCRYGADWDNPEIYVCYPGTPSQTQTKRNVNKAIIFNIKKNYKLPRLHISTH